MNPTSISKEVAGLSKFTLGQLQDRYAELFRERSLSHNRTWLIKRIGWGLQARVEGGLSERAKERARELARDADLRSLPPRPTTRRAKTQSSPSMDVTTTRTTTTAPAANVPPLIPKDRRLPAPGTILSRTYKGESLQVQVLENGFEFNGEEYASLSAVAKRITGSHLNGFRFFNLDGGGSR